MAERDYAILLLLVTYGLRAREIGALTLDDLDWKRDRLDVRARKAGHSTAYPLVPIVGEAILDYLKHGRPETTQRSLFIGAYAPYASLSHVAVSLRAKYYLRKAGIRVPRAADLTNRDGRRAHALLLTLYNSGARVSEIIGVRRDEIVLDAPASLKLNGKGRKERAVPLWAKTGQVLRAWFQELGDRFGGLAFPSARGGRLSRHGVSFLLSGSPTVRRRRVRAF